MCTNCHRRSLNNQWKALFHPQPTHIPLWLVTLPITLPLMLISEIRFRRCHRIAAAISTPREPSPLDAVLAMDALPALRFPRRDTSITAVRPPRYYRKGR